MDANKPVNLSISGKLTYSDDITLNQAAQIIAFIDNSSSMTEGAPASTSRLVSPQITTVTTPGTMLNPRDVLDASGAKTNSEKIVAFASMVLEEGKDTFILEDVKPLFRRAREATPANLSRDLDSAIRSNWVAEAEIKGEFYITNKGSEALKSGFAKEKGARNGVSSASKTSSSRKSKKNVEVPEAFKGMDPIPNMLENGLSYSSVKSQKDRLVWVAAMAKEHGIDGLTNQEVAWVTDFLGSGVPTNNINKAFMDARKANLTNRSTMTNKIRVTDDGIAYLSAASVKKTD